METGCTNEVCLSEVQLCILLPSGGGWGENKTWGGGGGGGVKKKHPPPPPPPLLIGPIDCTYTYMDQVHIL